MPLGAKRRWRTPRFLRSRSGQVGLGLVLLIIAMAVLGPVVAPYSPEETVGVPGSPPSGGFPLGTDILGRDVLSRVLSGGLSILTFATMATLLAYAVGMAIGLVAGYTRSLADSLLMRIVDLFLVFPALLVVLLAVAAFGGSPAILIGAVAVLQAPLIARVVRTATLAVASSGYVEAAVGRGDPLRRIFGRDLLPNIAGPVSADAGLRFTYSVLLIASVNYLGLGLAPPSSDWSLMIAENRQVLQSNALSVLAPALLIGLITVGLNLVGDAFAGSLESSEGLAMADTEIDLTAATGRSGPPGDAS